MDEMIRSLWCASLGVALVATATLAQNGAAIAGRVVTKASKAGIAGAEVSLGPGSRRVTSDAAGHFEFAQVPAGVVSLVVKRLGFAPESASFEVQSNEDLDVLIELTATVQQLDTVSVAGRSEPVATGKLTGFYDRKRVGIGKFIDGDEIAKEPHDKLGDLIAIRTPGSRLVRGRIGFVAWLATTRDSNLRPARAPMDPNDVRRGADPNACFPDVYIDGTNVNRFGTGAPLFDINSINAADVAAIEVYVGAARIPIQYNSSSAACGVLLIWLR